MKKWIYGIILIICICVGGFCAYQAWQIYNEDNEVELQTDKIKKECVEKKNENGEQILSPDWGSLKAINPDIVGWIYVPDCAISYPVVQGTNNSYYLDHTIYKGYNYMGSAFLDCNTNSDFSDDNNIIYGHSVQGGGMFTLLKNFSSKAFYDSHPVFYLLTPEQNYKCNIFCYSKSNNESVFYAKDFGEERQETLNKLKNEALYCNEDVDTDSPMVTLSTCDLDYGLHSNRRLLLSGFSEEYDETIIVHS